MKNKTYYLDNAATTKVDPRVLKAVMPFLTDNFGNPSSLYKPGVKAKEAIESARQSVAKVLSARKSEIIFTAGGTESANMAIFGIARQHQLSKGKPGHIIISSIEHDAVLKPAQALQEEGWKVSFLKVDESGFLNPKDIVKLIKPDTVLVSVMYANNEIGTVQNIPAISKELGSVNQTRAKKKLNKIFFHTDACQATNYLDIDVNKLGVDLMTINGSKINAFKQIGILYRKSSVSIRPVIFGGGQESGNRSGTENVAGIVSFAKALELACDQKSKSKLTKRLLSVQNIFNDRLLKKVSKLDGLNLVLNGPNLKTNGKYLQRLPNNLSYTFRSPEIEGESLMLYLDAKGIYVATGSACSTSSNDPSHVLIAIGRTSKEAKQTIRISLYAELTSKDIDYIVNNIVESIKLIA